MRLMNTLTPYPGAASPHTLLVPVPFDPACVGVTIYLQTLALSSPTDVLTNQASFELR